jgi:hypothetical protein
MNSKLDVSTITSAPFLVKLLNISKIVRVAKRAYMHSTGHPRFFHSSFQKNIEIQNTHRLQQQFEASSLDFWNFLVIAQFATCIHV